MVAGNYTVEETNPTGTTSVSDTDGGNDDVIAVDINTAESLTNHFVDAPQTGAVNGTVF